MNTRRVRAGSMPCASSGCNYPESDCLGICHHINTAFMTKPVGGVMPKELPVQMHDFTLREKFLAIFKKEWKA